MRYPRDGTIPIGREGENHSEYRTIQVYLYSTLHLLLELKCRS